MYRNPAPIFRFSSGCLTFDRKSNSLKGQLGKEVVVANKQPYCLGRVEPMVCAANECGTKIFYCGGRDFVPRHNDEFGWKRMI